MLREMERDNCKGREDAVGVVSLWGRTLKYPHNSNLNTETVAVREELYTCSLTVCQCRT